MERSNSGEIKDYLRNDFDNSQYWSVTHGRAKWQKAEATRSDLIHQDKKFFTSELFKVISLILHYRTMFEFRTTSPSTIIT